MLYSCNRSTTGRFQEKHNLTFNNDNCNLSAAVPPCGATRLFLGERQLNAPHYSVGMPNERDSFPFSLERLNEYLVRDSDSPLYAK